MRKKIINYIIRYLLAAIFLFSGIGKLINPYPAVQFMNAFVPTSISFNVIHSAIILVSVIEILVAIMLVFRIKLSIALPVAGALIIMFTVFLGIVYVKQQNVASCGCFGSFDPGLSLPLSMVRNLVILILIVVSYIRETPKKQ